MVAKGGGGKACVARASVRAGELVIRADSIYGLDVREL